MITNIPPLFKKPYFYIILLFILHMLFLDSNNFIAQYKIRRTLKQLTQEKEFYERETQSYQNENDQLMNDPEALERFARTRYLMKRDNEDIFLFMDKKDLQGN